jgi:uncharacterized protein with beta-barrel porin domain
VPPQVGAVAGAINTAIGGAGSIEGLPTAFQTLIRFASASELADILKQLAGEAATGTAQVGTQAMNSFLSQLTSPFPDSNRATPENRPAAAPMVTKGPMVNKADPLGSVADPRRWGIWAAGYGGQTNAAGDVAGIGSHDRSVSFYGYASGLDYQVTPSTLVGFALAGGATSFGLSDNLGGGRSNSSRRPSMARRISMRPMSRPLSRMPGIKSPPSGF